MSAEVSIVNSYSCYFKIQLKGNFQNSRFSVEQMFGVDIGAIC